MRRRSFLRLPWLALPAIGPQALGAQGHYPAVEPGHRLAFPRDHGAHPAFRNEWWYVTGWLRSGAREIGFQVTFFRNRPRIAEESASRFAPKQLLFAHAALADPEAGRLIHEQRAAREGFDLARAVDSDTDVKIGSWSFLRGNTGYAARISARDFGLALEFRPAQALLLQGERGYSRKGPLPRQASFYYSWPQLAVSGAVNAAGRSRRVEGRAWLDHEWSSEPLAPEAAGWDWAGLNGADGSALMAFRIRGRDGSPVWAGGSYRDASGRATAFRPDEIRFETLRSWRSARTGVEYPVSMKVIAGPHEIVLTPLMDDQELDARGSTATIYWEGAVKASVSGKAYGEGYLELTGYWRPLKL
jgi:predicted secreted hydrolase